MDVIERSKYVDEEGKISLVHRLSATLDFGTSWYGRMEAQNVATQRLGRALKEQHILLRNIPVPGVDEQEPYMILIGPQGIRILMAFPTLGVFRANEREWLKLDQRSRSFVHVKPNLLTLALGIQKQVSRLLEIQSFRAPVAESVLLFTHPRTLIDGTRPACRIVSADAIEYFAANLEQLPRVISDQQMHTLVDAILYPKLPDPLSAGSLINDSKPQRSNIPSSESSYEPAFHPDPFRELEESPFTEMPDDDFLQSLDQHTFDEDSFYEIASSEETPESKNKKAGSSRKPRMSKSQLGIIAILVIIEIIIILYFAWIVLQDTGML
jgi:hypothetical protein